MMRCHPKNKEGSQIKEVDLDEIFDNLFPIECTLADSNGVCRGNPRYHRLAKQRQCACCGIIGNRLFLEPIPDEDGYQYNLYAETRYTPEREPVFILLTQDHKIARRLGGEETNENVQILCMACNQMKDLFEGREVTNEQMRKILDVAGYINKSRSTIRHTRQNLRRHLESLDKMGRDATSILANIDKASGVNRLKMHARVGSLLDDMADLKAAIDATLLDAQTKGVIHSSLLGWTAR